jgi:sulfhydrogenase subunit alpha
MNTKTIKVDYLARVEGEGSLLVKIKDRKVSQVQFKIFEPPRFFEAMLRGRKFTEAPDITARICGICPVAYQLSSAQAMEDALGISVDKGLRDLRRLIYCGEWIQSHALHIYMLHAPDFLGYESVISMAKDFPDIVQRGLQLKKAGNEIMTLIGGREVHPVNLAVGGFYKVPTKNELQSLEERLVWARDAALETIVWVSAFDFPEFDMEYEFVALHHPEEYAITDGRLISNKGLDIAVRDYDKHFEEMHELHTHALHSKLRKRGAYFVGPLARFNLNFDQLSTGAKAAAKAVDFLPECRNPFKSIIARSVELFYACEEALRLVQAYVIPERSMMELPFTAGTGFGCTEAPRGICFHRYQLDEEGIILDAKICPPTSQNQKQIESDLLHYVEKYIDLPKDQLTWQCEQAIRNYDPCISCATHFLKLDVEEE